MQKKFLLFVLVLILGAIGFAIYSAHQRTRQMEEHAGKAVSKSTTEEAAGENVTFTVTEAEHKKWELKVKKVKYFRNTLPFLGKTLFKAQAGANLEGVQGQFFDEHGNPVAAFTAPTGIFLDADKAVFLDGGVLVKATDKSRGELHSDQLTWSTKTQQATAKGHIQLIMDNRLQATSNTCQFALDFSVISLLGRAQSTLKL